MVVPTHLLPFWQAYAAAAGRPVDAHFLEAFHFGDSAALADELAALVLSGRKRATAQLLWAAQSDGRRPPQPGDLSIVTLGSGEPVCVIETESVVVMPFADVPADFAAAEGEGDGSLAYWRDAHRRYFGRVCQAAGRSFSEDDAVVCERFRVVYPAQPQPGAVFHLADLRTDRRALIELNVEYMDWVFAGIDAQFGVCFAEQIGVSARDYVPTVIDEICGQRAPDGGFYLLRVAGEAAGMGGLCRIDAATAEIKRVYVRPSFRGRQLGEQSLQRLLADAADFGYRRVVLNSALFMTTAHRLYERQGFVDCAPYAGAEVPPDFVSRWRYMTRPLPAPAG